MDADELKRALRAIRLVRAPSRKLATFGDTRIAYHLVSAQAEERLSARLREGVVLAERPKILTAEALSERFQGFGSGSEEAAELLKEVYRDPLRALEYRFRNEPGASRLVREEPRALADRIKGDLDAREEPLAAVLLAPEGGWQLALMKFILEQSIQSFPTHVRDLDRRGLFDPGKKARGRLEKELESLFAAAAEDPHARDRLGRRLRETGMFEAYEDRFFALFRP